MKRIIFIVVIFVLLFGGITTTKAIAPERKLTEYTTFELVSYFSKQYQVSEPQMLGVMNCESGGKQSAVGDHGLARGVYQYHQPTWDRFSEEIGEKLDRESAFDQIKLTAFAFSRGYQSHWTCFKILKMIK